jgi:hypothetical protein
MSSNPLHDHLDVCDQCLKNPLDLCPDGVATAEALKKRLDYEGTTPRTAAVDTSSAVPTSSEVPKP